MEQRDSFVFYRSFYEAIKDLDDEEQLKLYRAIFEYSLNGNEPKKDTNDVKSDANSAVILDTKLMAIFVLIKPNIDNANNRYNTSVSNGRKGRSPIKKPKKT